MARCSEQRRQAAVREGKAIPDLPPDERASLARTLLLGLDEPLEAELMETWLSDAERRARELDPRRGAAGLRGRGAAQGPSLASMTQEMPMKIKVVVHEAEEGGYWAEVPSIPGCATQGESFEELLGNLYEAVEGCLSVDVQDVVVSEKDRVFEIAV